jgi:hypothetical protein
MHMLRPISNSNLELTKTALLVISAKRFLTNFLHTAVGLYEKQCLETNIGLLRQMN